MVFGLYDTDDVVNPNNYILLFLLDVDVLNKIT